MFCGLVTCDQAVLTDAETAPAQIARVLRSARERSLPVYFELPRDMTGAPAAAVPVLPERPADLEALAECADEIIEKLAQASAPVILVDVEVRRYALEPASPRWRARSGCSQRRLDPRRTMLAFDRAVRVGHHLYPDVPIVHLIDALADRARPR